MLYKVVALEQVPEGEVQVYYIKADKWKSYPTWPIEADTGFTLHLTTRPNSENPEAYALSATAPVPPQLQDKHLASGTLTFQYDPLNPVMSVGGETLFSSSTRRGSLPQPPIGYRNDILFFLSEPLSHPLTIAGTVKATLYVSSDCEDTSFTYKISEVEADGATHNIRSGITTLAYRNNRYGARQSYTPQQIVELHIETLPVTWQVKPGNRIRVDITSSNFPEYSIHTNYPGPWAEQTATRIATQTIYTGREYPSRITFPTIQTAL